MDNSKYCCQTIDDVVFYFKRCPVCNYFNETHTYNCFKCKANLRAPYTWIPAGFNKEK